MFHRHKCPMSRVALSDDGKFVVSVLYDGTVRVRNILDAGSDGRWMEKEAKSREVS